MVKKAEKEITFANDIVMGDIYIGTGETDAVHILAKAAKVCRTPVPESVIIFPAGIPPS